MKIKELILKNINGRKVLFFFILTNLVYAFMLLVTIPKTMSFSGGMKLLDMMPSGYSPEYINTLFTALGEIGRNTYLYNQIPADMIYPGLFAIGYCLLIAFFINKLKKTNKSLFYICLLPVFAGFFDYLENFGIIAMLINYPDLSNTLASITNIFTIIKSVLTTVYFIALIVTIAILGIKSIGRKRI